MKALIGLGNPGREYELTRHNVGFLALDVAADLMGAAFSKRQCQGLLAETRFRGERVALLKPQTYMNLSGNAVEALIQWFKLEPEDVFILSDDIDLPQGALRIRARGASGTHNGWRSIRRSAAAPISARAHGRRQSAAAVDLKDWVLSAGTRRRRMRSNPQSSWPAKPLSALWSTASSSP